MTGMQRVMTTWSFRECLTGKAFLQNTRETFCLAILSCFVLPSLYPHYIYSHYPHIVRSVFQRENLKKYTWKLEIVIPKIIYTFPCGFPLLLPLYIQIFKRLIAQTLTTPNMSVKWGFGAARKHWKKPFIGGCNWAELRDLGKLEKTRFRETSWQ